MQFSFLHGNGGISETFLMVTAIYLRAEREKFRNNLNPFFFFCLSLKEFWGKGVGGLK